MVSFFFFKTASWGQWDTKVLWIPIGSLSGTETRLPLHCYCQATGGEQSHTWVWGSQGHSVWGEEREPGLEARHGAVQSVRQAQTQRTGVWGISRGKRANRQKGPWRLAERWAARLPAAHLTCPPRGAHHPATQRAATGRGTRCWEAVRHYTVLGIRHHCFKHTKTTLAQSLPLSHSYVPGVLTSHKGH